MAGTGLRFSPQALLLAAVLFDVAIVLSAPHSLIVVITVVALVAMVCLLTEASFQRILLRSLPVLPVAGMMALLTPLRGIGSADPPADIASLLIQSAPLILQLVLTSWLSVLVMLALAAICSFNDMLYAAERLRLPQALVLLLAFVYRYVGLFRSQLQSMRTAMVLRAPTLGVRRQVLLYGNLAGALIVRAQARGNRIHSAMLARGFAGKLPHVGRQAFGLPDAALLAVTVLLGFAFFLV